MTNTLSDKATLDMLYVKYLQIEQGDEPELELVRHVFSERIRQLERKIENDSRHKRQTKFSKAE